MVARDTDSNWIQTYSGLPYWPANPRVEDVRLEDIAHGLSMLCRYAGQTRKFFSVAEHCVHVSHLVPPELALEGLLHDASEAYCSDIVRPLKQVLPGYKRVEARNMAVIREKFGLPPKEHPLVKKADTSILLVELKDLLPPFAQGYTFGVTDRMQTPVCKIYGWNPREAEIFFLDRFHEITKDWS